MGGNSTNCIVGGINYCIYARGPLEGLSFFIDGYRRIEDYRTLTCGYESQIEGSAFEVLSS